MINFSVCTSGNLLILATITAEQQPLFPFVACYFETNKHLCMNKELHSVLYCTPYHIQKYRNQMVLVESLITFSII